MLQGAALNGGTLADAAAGRKTRRSRTQDRPPHPGRLFTLAAGDFCCRKNHNITVPFDNCPEALASARGGKIEKYSDLDKRLRVRQEYKAEVHLHALVVGSLESYHPENDKLLKRLRISGKRIPTLRRKMVSAAIQWSRDIYVEHITGIRQYQISAARTNARRNGKEIDIAWLDKADAFGSVPHRHTSRVLQEMAMLYSMIRLIIEDMYQEMTTEVEVRDESTAPITIKSGIRQGDPLSPLLFNLALEHLLRVALHKQSTRGYQIGKHRISALASTDDVLLLAKSAGLLHQLLHTVSAAANWSGLLFKPRKCASLHLDCTRGRQRHLLLSFNIQGTPIILRSAARVAHRDHAGKHHSTNHPRHWCTKRKRALPVAEIRRGENLLAPETRLPAASHGLPKACTGNLGPTNERRRPVVDIEPRNTASAALAGRSRTNTPCYPQRRADNCTRVQDDILRRHSPEALLISPSHRKQTVPLFRRAIAEGMRRSITAKKDQGKVLEAASRHPASSHFLRDVRHTRVCE
ncbi:hypothetical protein J437_LFUL019122 [Ladona fulva]|uniref:Reverse transcriptase domain-containing protein n=1 Tax=Ladona fulva TaxID=123851 RepID=A0A8K0KQF6_LADFU|nr:hypothetical protein J437_LFUL019122 [Ladona fulva]